MIKASHHRFIYPLFCHLTRRLMKWHFHSTQFVGSFHDRGLPLLVLANHTGWWDGFWILYHNLKYWNRRLFFMMLEEQLRKHWYFRHAGGFSVKRNSRSAFESIQYAAEILQDNRNMLLLFPQGELHSIYDHDFIFQSGTSQIIERCKNEIQILMVANLVDFYAHRRPTLYTHIETYQSDAKDIHSLQEAYREFYQKTLTHHINSAER